jgi:hypothetical protein
VVQFIENGLGLLPGIASGLKVVGSVQRIAEVRERVSFVVAVGQFPVQAERTFEAVDGLRMLAEFAMGVAKAVPGRGLARTVTEFLE